MRFVREHLPDPSDYYTGQGLTLKGRGKWRTACCPLHGGESLRVNVESGAFACMGGCDFHGGDVLSFHMQRHGLDFVEAAKALNAWQDDGQPAPTRPAPISPRSAIELLARECSLVAVAAANVGRGVTLTETDRGRVLKAAGRVNRISEIFK